MKATRTATPPYTLPDHSRAGQRTSTQIEDEIIRARALLGLLHYANLGRVASHGDVDYPDIPKEYEKSFSWGVVRITELLEAHFDTIVALAYQGAPADENAMVQP